MCDVSIYNTHPDFWPDFCNKKKKRIICGKLRYLEFLVNAMWFKVTLQTIGFIKPRRPLRKSRVPSTASKRGSTVYMYTLYMIIISIGNVVTVPPIGVDELPPPYSPAASGGIPMIQCKVCQSMINIEGKQHQHVVKCTSCDEATVCIQLYV